MLITALVIACFATIPIMISQGRKKARDEDSFETPFGEIVNVPNRHGAVR